MLYLVINALKIGLHMFLNHFFFLLQLQSKSIICQQKCVLVIASYEKSIQKLTQSMTLNGIRYGITQLFQSHSALYVNASKRRKKNKTKKISFEM